MKIDVPRKYLFARYQLVFLAYNKAQIFEFLNMKQYARNYWLKELKINDLHLVDFNLINYRFYEHTADRIPFLIKASINYNCHFCLRTVVKRLYFGKEMEYTCYHCTCRIIRLMAAQVDPKEECQIIQSCCGSFVKLFYKKILKNDV